MTFPPNYPFAPPTFQFTRPLYHPNIYPDGKLCISILHSPGEDEMSGESAGERWSPVQRVESVLLSIISLLDDAETASPANVDAGVLLRRDAEAYRKRVGVDVGKSREDIPEGFVMPTHESTVGSRPVVEKVVDDREFWVDSDMEEDEEEEDGEGFGGSETDEEGDDGEGLDQEEVEMMEDAEDEEGSEEGEMQEFVDDEGEGEGEGGKVKEGKAGKA